MICEALIILAGLFGLGVVGGLERGMMGIGTALVLLALTAVTIAVLAGLRKARR